MPGGADLMTTTREFAVSASAFGADLYQRLAQDRANMVFSPVSVASALWMAWCGARGRTGAERARALHPGGPAAARNDKNHVIGEQPAGKSTGLGPTGGRAPLTGLVLANAMYLKAAWL